MSDFDQKKFNIHTVKVLQEILERVGNFNKPLADDFAVLCELIWTYDPEDQSFASLKGSNHKAKVISKI